MKTVSAKLSYSMSIMQTILFILKDSLHHAWKHFLRAHQCKYAKCLLVAFVSFRIQHGEQTASLQSIGSHGILRIYLGVLLRKRRGEIGGVKPERSKSPFKQDVLTCQPVSYQGWVPLRISSWGKKRGSFTSKFLSSVDQRLFPVLSIVEEIETSKSFCQKVQGRKETCRLQETIVWTKRWWEGRRQCMGSVRRGSRFHQFIVQTHSLLMKFKDRRFCEVALSSPFFKSTLLATITM